MSNFKKYMSIIEAMGALPPDLLDDDGELITPENELKFYDKKVYKNIVLDTIESFIKDDKNQKYINEITKTSGRGNYKGVPGKSILDGMMQSQEPLSEEAFKNLLYDLEEPKVFVDKVISYYMSLSDQKLTEDEFSTTIKKIANI